MNIEGSVALVTGANRGIGRALASDLLARGAKVYATARRPETVDLPGAEVLPLDITDQASAEAVAERATDVDLLINNAGITTYQNLVTGDLPTIHSEMDVHFYGTLRMTRAFAPILAANGGGALVNIMSALSFKAYPGASAYAAAKAAEWMLTTSVRLELAKQRTMVVGAFLAATDTDMMAGYGGPMNDPADVARIILDGVQKGQLEVIVDDDTAQARANLVADVASAYPTAVSH